MNLFIRLLGLLLCGLLCESLKTLGKAQIELEFWFRQFAPPYFVTDVPRRRPVPSGATECARSGKKSLIHSTNEFDTLRRQASFTHVKCHTNSLPVTTSIGKKETTLVWRLFKLKIRHNALLKLKSRGITNESDANWRTFSHTSAMPFFFRLIKASTAVCDIKGDVPLKARHDLPFLDTLAEEEGKKWQECRGRKNGKVFGIKSLSVASHILLLLVRSLEPPSVLIYEKLFAAAVNFESNSICFIYGVMC